MTNELHRVYGKGNVSKATRTSDNVKLLRKRLEWFQNNQVEYLGEVSSLAAIPCEHTSTADLGALTIIHTCAKVQKRDTTLLQVFQMTDKAEKILEDAEHLTRQVASEILVFMLSDVNREYKPERPHAIPIAYGLKGYSLKAETLRNMIAFVLRECEARGLRVPIVSFDGQWSRIALRNDVGDPLTVLQLQKDVFMTARSMPKSEQISQLMSSNRVENVQNMNEAREKIEIMSPVDGHGRLDIGGSLGQPSMKVPSNAISGKPQKGPRHSDISEKDDETFVDYVLHTLPAEERMALDSEMESVIKDINEDISNDRTTTEPPEQPHVELTGSCINPYSDDNEENTDVSQKDAPSIQDDIKRDALTKLKTQCSKRRSNTWQNMSQSQFEDILSTSESISKFFICSELSILIGHFLSNGVTKKSWKKKDILVNELFEILGLASSKVTCVRKKTTTPKSLRNLCKAVISTKFPKDYLNVIFAYNLFPKKLRVWNASSAEKRLVKVGENIQPTSWYSHPIQTTNSILFPILDSEHLLVNMRVKCCSTGIKEAGLSRDAWLNVAKNARTTKQALHLHTSKILLINSHVHMR